MNKIVIFWLFPMPVGFLIFGGIIFFLMVAFGDLANLIFILIVGGGGLAIVLGLFMVLLGKLGGDQASVNQGLSIAANGATVIGFTIGFVVIAAFAVAIFFLWGLANAS